MRRNKCRWLNVVSGALLGALSGQVYSADLMSIYQLALGNDSILRAALNENEAVKQAGRQVKGLYYPSLRAGYEHIETDQVINESENDVFGSGESDYPSDVLSLSLTQPVFRWDYFNQRKVSKAAMRQADFQYTAAQQEMMLRSAEAYLLALAAKDDAFVSTAERDSMSQQLDLANKRLEVGLGNPSAVQESVARLEFNRAQLIEAENVVIDREEGLRVITGAPIDSLLSLREDLKMSPPEPANQEDWIARALASNLTIQALQAAVDVAQASYKAQQADRYPTLDLVARFNNRDSGGSLFGGGSNVDTTDIVLQGNWTVFQGGILRAKIKESMFKKQQAENELDLAKANVRRETRNAYLGVVSSIAKAKALGLSMRSQENTVKAKEKGFETGVSSNVEVLDAKRDFYFVQRDFLKVRYDYLISLLNLKRQVGSLSPEDLQTINGMLGASAKPKKLSAAPKAVKKMPAEPKIMAKPVAKAKVAPAKKAEKLEAQAPVKAKVEPTKVVASVSGEIKGGANNQDVYQWLFTQTPTDYTILVASLGSAKDAASYIKSNNLKDAHFLSPMGAGKGWHLVLSGAYSSWSKANEAAKSLEVASEPWVKKISVFQKSRCGDVTLEAELKSKCQQVGYMNKQVLDKQVLAKLKVKKQHRSLVASSKKTSVNLSSQGAFQWLFKQNPDEYTIQVASLDSIDEVNAFVRQHKLSDAYFFTSTVEGRPKYRMIVSGAYTSRRAALEAAKQLGLPTTPWVRKIAKVQHDRCQKNGASSVQLASFCDEKTRSSILLGHALTMVDTKKMPRD
ncbi:MAG: TolC family outer membrane protein [Arenicellales bacterium]